MALGRETPAYKSISRARLALTEGWVVSIDPSIGSSSSLPGWAVYYRGNLHRSGVFEIDRNGTDEARLQQLAHAVRKLYSEYDPDCLVYEDIPAQRYGGGNAKAHSSLLKAVGVILSISGPDYYVGILPISWTKLVREGYTKGDEEDAREIGYVCIQEARKIIEEDGLKERKKFGEKKKAAKAVASGK